MITNKNEFSEIIGASPRHVTNLIREGMPVDGTGKKGSPLKIDTAKALAWWRDREVEKQLGKVAREAGDPETRKDADRRLAAARADRAEVEAARARAEVIPMADAQFVMNEAMAVIASQLDGLGGRLASELAAISEPAAIRQKLLAETRRIRAAAADRLAKLAAIGRADESP